jgi:hypothetical protein
MSRTPLVRCGGCAFEWFGATSAHGLRIVGTCPRCGGALDFLAPIADDQVDEPLPGADDTRSPALVLGTPLRR